ncbi:MAG: DNA-3-methyladenine glycosylase 2 family protein [Rhizobacter sp.]|nr:DNA-3-methyladenine glycosylase 2 family protein [Chlorobiales bacterium]
MIKKLSAFGLHPPTALLREEVARLCEMDSDFARIEAEAGALHVRRFPASFESLVRIILGQQLSTKAADSIFLTLKQAMPAGRISPETIAASSAPALRKTGLSGAKVICLHALSAAMLAGRLELKSLHRLPDEEVITRLTAIKGIGLWTAEIYLLFALERTDVFPAADLALQLAYQHLKNLPVRPLRSEFISRCESLRPRRGVVAHLLWHYYRHLKTRLPAVK